MQTKKKTTKRAKNSKSAYTKKEMQEIHDMVDKVLLTDVGATKEEIQGMVIVSHKTKEGQYLTVGGRRNISNESLMLLVLRIIGMEPMDGAIMLATINAEQQKFVKAESLLKRAGKLASRKKK